ncbi:MAG: hypothetical protein AAGA32_05305 [Pseudomonadota bacterium]
MRLLLCLLLVSLSLPVHAQSGRLGVELNKLEEGEAGGCRAFFLFRNGIGETLEAFEMSLAILAPSGVIDRLLTIDAAPLPAARTTLKLFEIPELACTGVGEIILHDIAACTPQNADPIDCYTFLDLTSLAEAELVK